MLQKIKKIAIIALAFAFLSGATLISFNLYSRFLILRYLKEYTGYRARLEGYSFNIFGSLKFRNLVLDDALEINDFVVKYNATALLLQKTVSTIRIGRIFVNPGNFKPRKSGKSSKGTFKFSIPLQVKELKIEKGLIVLDSNSINFDNLYASGERMASAYRIRAYINRLAFEGENLYIYTDLMLKSNQITLRALEIQNKNLSIAGTSGYLNFPDSLNLKVEMATFHDYSLNRLSVACNLKERSGRISIDNLFLKDRTVRDVKATFALNLPESLILKSASFKFRDNSVVGEGVYLFKEKRLLIHQAKLSLQEYGFKGVLYASLLLQPDKIEGKVRSKDLTYMQSKPFQLSSSFTYSGKNLYVLIPTFSSTHTNLHGSLSYNPEEINVELKGIFDPGEVLKDVHGTIEANLKYTIRSKERKGFCYVVARGINHGDLKVEKANLSLVSVGEQEDLSLEINNIQINKMHFDSITVAASSEQFKKISMNISGASETLKFEGNASVRREKDTLGLTLKKLRAVIKQDTLEINKPFRIVKTKAGFAALDSAKIFVNGTPVTIAGSFKEEDSRVDAIAIWQDVYIRQLFGVSGIVTGFMEIGGSLQEPQILLSLNGSKIYYRDFRDLNLYLTARLNTNGLIVDSASISGENMNLLLTGFLPAKFSFAPFEFVLLKDDEYTFRTKIYDLPAEIFAEITRQQFVLTNLDLICDVIIFGRLTETPRLNGYLRISNASGMYTPLQLEFTRADILAELTEDRFEIKKGLFTVDHGNLLISGYGKNLFYASREINLFIKASNVSLYPVYNIYASGAGDINVNIKESGISVKGDLTVSEATIFQTLRPVSVSSSPPPKNLTVLLNITSEGNTFLVNELADIEVKGNFIFQLTEGKTLLDGNAEVIKGYFLYLDRIFEVEFGYVNFTSTGALEPNLSIKASSTVDTFTITMNLTGTFQNPQISLNSEPPLDELNILYLLTLGRVYGDTSAFQSTELQDLKNRAFSLASTVISQNLRRSLRFQELRLESSGNMENPSLLIGLYLTPKLYFWYSHDIFDITKDMFQVRYKLKRNFGVFAERDQEQKFQLGVDYLYEF